MRNLRNFFRCFESYRSFQRLPARSKELVFYAENSGDWNYLGGAAQLLSKNYQVSVVYLTSDQKDLDRKLANPEISFFYIGEGLFRTLILNSLRSKLAVMTMPDLGQYYIKRSPFTTHYSCVIHSLVSSHMSFREKAFDEFDSICVVGPYQEEEIRERESKFHLKRKQILKTGFPKLDYLLKENKNLREQNTQILLAPTWGPSSITFNCLEETISELLKTSHTIVFRPHPYSFKQKEDAKKIHHVKKKYAGENRLVFDFDPANKEYLLSSTLMISDWSGAALEYSFGQLRPVIFIDLPRKTVNPHYEMLTARPIEDFIRFDIGKVISSKEIELLPQLVLDLLKNSATYQQKIQEHRKKWIFNVGKANEALSQELYHLYQQLR